MAGKLREKIDSKIQISINYNKFVKTTTRPTEMRKKIEKVDCL